MADFAAFGSNAYGVQVTQGAFAQDEGPLIKTYHGIAITVNNNIIGRIQSWNPTFATREGTHQWELSYVTWGRPVDYVPGRQTGYTIAMTRTEVWNEELEIALGLTNSGNPFQDLADQEQAFDCDEQLFRSQTAYRTWVYKGCWLSERNENEYSAEGDGIYTANAGIAYVSRVRTL